MLQAVFRGCVGAHTAAGKAAAPLGNHAANVAVPSLESHALLACSVIRVVMPAGHVSANMVQARAHILGCGTKAGEAGRHRAPEIMRARWIGEPARGVGRLWRETLSEPCHGD